MTEMKSPTGVNPTDYCRSCGQPARVPGAHYCARCFTDRQQAQRGNENLLNRARNAAIARLRLEFPDRWDELYAEEKAKLKATD